MQQQRVFGHGRPAQRRAEIARAFVVAAVLAAGGGARAQAGERQASAVRVGVCLQPTPQPAPAWLPGMIEAVEAAAGEAGAQVVSSAALQPTLDELQRQGLRCEAGDVECYSKIGIYTGLERLLALELRAQEGGWEISLLLIDALEGKAAGRVHLGPLADPAAELEAVRTAVRDLLARPRSNGTLQVRVLRQDLVVLVDGAPVTPALAVVDVAELAPGPHSVEVRTRDRSPHKLQVSLEPGEHRTVEVALAAAETEPAPAPEPAVAAAPPASWPQWLGAALAGGGTAIALAGALTGVTGELSYRVASTRSVDVGQSAALQERKQQLEQGTALAYTGVGAAAVGAAIAVGGAALWGWSALAAE